MTASTNIPSLSAPRHPLVWVGLFFLALVGIRTAAHPSLWSHLATGQWIAENGIPRVDSLSFTAPEGTRWIAETWLYDLLLAGVWKAGAPLATLLHVAAVVAAVGLLIPVARRYAGPASILWGILLCGWLLAPLFEIRPGVLTLLFPALFIAVCHIPRRPAILWGILVPAQILWTNLHPSFLIGPFIAAAFAWESSRPAAAADREPAGAAPGWPLVAALLAVTLLNPYGPLLYGKVWWLVTDPARSFSYEWISPFAGLFGSPLPRRISTIALAVLAAGLVLYRDSLPKALLACAILGTVIALHTGIQVKLLAMLSFPLLCMGFEQTGQALKEWIPMLRRAGWATIPALGAAAASVVLIAGNHYYRTIGSASAFGFGADTQTVPAAAADLIGDPAFPARCLHLPMDGGYLAWALPERQVFLDPRNGVHDPALLQQTFAAMTGDDPSYRALMAQWQPGAILLNGAWLFADAAVTFLLRTGDWSLAYFDGTSIILLPAMSPTPAIADLDGHRRRGLALLEQTRTNYRQRIAARRPTPVSPRLIGAGNVFYALQQFPEAAAAYELLTLNAPGMQGAWIKLGVSQLQAGFPEPAVTSLRNACAAAPDHAAAHLWLSRACAGAGLHEQALQAYQRGQALSPEDAERFGPPANSPGPGPL
jgi:hypothetical protein